MQTLLNRLGLTLCLVLVLGVLWVPAVAQDATEPEEEETVAPMEFQPADPVWRAFNAVRRAIEEEEPVDLTYVRSWAFQQTEWQVSIDSCREDITQNEWRQVYFGWNFNIVSLQGVSYNARVSFDLRAIVICDIEEAPAGGGSATIPVNVTPGGGLQGNFELGGHIQDFTAEGVQAMQSSGMTWVKKQLRYTPGMGTGQAAGYLQAARDNGFKLLLGVVGYPEDLAAGGQAYIDGFANFLGEVAALGVHAIEVWNEPNIDREWPAGQISGENYVNMLRPAYNAIKARNPNTIVISGAPAPTGFFGAAGCTAQGCNDDVFMQQMAAAGANNYMDCVGLHYNEGIISPTQFSGDPRGGFPTYYFSSMTSRGWNAFNGKQICYTELGYLSGEGFNTPIPAGFAWAENVTVAQHAQWLAEAATLAAQSGRVRMMIVWNVNFTRWDSDPMAGYAMIRPDGSCPACITLGRVMGR